MLRFVSRAAACGAIALLVPWMAPGSAKIFNATPASIKKIWANARSGDTIKLAGAFGVTRLQNKVSAKAITLDATDAVFSNSLEIVRVNGLHVIGGKFDITGGVSRDRSAAVVLNGANVAFDRPTIIGDGSQAGIGFVDMTHVRVTGGTFTGLTVGIGFEHVTSALLTGNTITRATIDGIDIGDSHDVSATFNSCSGSVAAPGRHPDCIQLWSVAGRPLQSDNVVSDNTATGNTQGFTSFAGGGGGIRLSFLRNTANVAFVQGVACYNCIDSNISYNNVTTIAGSQYQARVTVIGGTNNIVAGNTNGVKPGPAGSPRSLDEASSPPPFSITSLAGNGPPAGLVSSSGSASAVTEPGSWAMLVAGFGFIGFSVRRRGWRVAAA